MDPLFAHPRVNPVVPDVGWATGQIRNTTFGATNLTLGWKDDAVTHQMTVMATYPGDANMDGTVDVTDLNTVLSYYNTPNVWNHGDFNYDGTVDVTDLNTVLSYYNTSNVVSVAEDFGPVFRQSRLYKNDASLSLWQR